MKNNILNRDDTKKAEIHLAEKYEEQIAIDLPLAWNWTDRYTSSLSYMFAFTVAVTALDCTVGDLILDFACGSGWISEWLKRLGYRTVSIDISTILLSFARKRMACDSRINLDDFPAYFVACDAEKLPLRDETFDGIICMNSLHHMPDYQTIFDEMYRILKGHGRAVFSEPGCMHSKSPASIREMEESGVLERDIVLSDIYDKALRTGFREVTIKPMLQPNSVDFTYLRWQRFLNNMPGVGEEYLQSVRDFVEQCNPIFALHKGVTEREKDSRKPGLLRARIEIIEAPDTVICGSDMIFKFSVKNIGDTLWLSEDRRFGGRVTLGAKLLASNKRIIDNQLGRASLPKNITPGESVAISMRLKASMERGNYVVKFDMVCERITWFEAAGSEPALVQLAVI
jgi:ubiquinone/menaquinone biosynthesis C-methylase UbiE